MIQAKLLADIENVSQGVQKDMAWNSAEIGYKLARHADDTQQDN
jgi:hypothetical protein